MDESKTYEKKKIVAIAKMPIVRIDDKVVEMTQVDDDIINDLLTGRLTAKVYERTKKEQTVFGDIPRQKFWDYIRRRKQCVAFNVRSFDYLAEDGKTAIPAFEVTTINK